MDCLMWCSIICSTVHTRPYTQLPGMEVMEWKILGFSAQLSFFAIYIHPIVYVGFSSTWQELRSSSSSTTVLAMAPLLVMIATKFKAKMVNVLKKVNKIALDDPRRIIHSLKLGLALTFMSMVYYINPLYDGFSINTLWAVFTVVFVMEYTVGGTLSKGLNWAFATLQAGALGVGVHYLVVISGRKAEPILLGCFIFLLATGATFSRFIPEIRARYDYGVLIFIPTFTLVALSDRRVDETIGLTKQMMSTIFTAVATCIIISVCLFPIWAGGNLNDLVAQNLEILATYLEGLTESFVEKRNNEEEIITTSEDNKSYLQVYQTVLNSKATEEVLINLATWEPGHGSFSYRHPWEQYLKIGASSRRCACCIEALNSKITESAQPHVTSESQRKIRETCYSMCAESSKALKEVVLSMRTMTVPSAAKAHIVEASKFVKDLKLILVEEHCLSEMMNETIIASILSEVVMSTQLITKSTMELARLGGFKTTANLSMAAVRPVSDEEGDNRITITIPTRE